MTTSSLGTGHSVIMMPFWLISGSAFRKWSSPLLAGMLSLLMRRVQLKIDYCLASVVDCALIEVFKINVESK